MYLHHQPRLSKLSSTKIFKDQKGSLSLIKSAYYNECLCVRCQICVVRTSLEAQFLPPSPNGGFAKLAAAVKAALESPGAVVVFLTKLDASPFQVERSHRTVASFLWNLLLLSSCPSISRFSIRYCTYLRLFRTNCRHTDRAVGRRNRRTVLLKRFLILYVTYVYVWFSKVRFRTWQISWFPHNLA